MQEEQSREDMGPRLGLTFDSTKVTVYCMAARYMLSGQLPQQVLFPYLHLSRMLRAGERGSIYMPNKYNNPLLYDSQKILPGLPKCLSERLRIKP